MKKIKDKMKNKFAVLNPLDWKTEKCGLSHGRMQMIFLYKQNQISSGDVMSGSSYGLRIG